jgi:rSAM/selenodomain-associated transferase 2
VRLSIVIPALNEAPHIARAVASAWQSGADEVIVVDGGSDDGTLAVLAGLECTLLTAPRGRAAQQNAGATVATGDVILFLHADNHLAAGDVARQIAGSFSDPRRLHGSLRQQIDAPGIRYRLIEWGNALRVRWLGMPYGDQAIFVRRDALWRAGGFPDEPLLEDLILMRRLRKHAWPALLAGPVVVSPRRWQKHGVLGQTLRNWCLVARYWLGTPPAALARHYQRHDARD